MIPPGYARLIRWKIFIPGASPKNRDGDASFEIPAELDHPDASRGVFGKVALKVFNLFARKAMAGKIEFFARELEEKQMGNHKGLVRINRNFELEKMETLNTGQPFLLFIHGTNSSTVGSFGELPGTELWNHIVHTYDRNILAFQHETLTKNPLQNAWELVKQLPANIDLHIISHSKCIYAYSNGYHDGENISFNDLLILVTKITHSVHLPVTADIESGYAADDIQLQENIQLLINTGIAGINIEDTDKKTNTLVSIESQCNKIRLIRKTADEMGIPFFINARTDVYIHEKSFASEDAKLNEAIKRGLAYKEAGADGFYPITLTQEQHIKEIIDQVKLPLNILTIPGIPDFKTLHELGVARMSLGPSFLKIAIGAMKELALQLKDGEGLSLITGNEITSDYLKSLVNKN
ncbi:MAG: isocitrate lyase/phosphoenolpyruvate mutase family protein [Bacteroidota bacterium]